MPPQFVPLAIVLTVFLPGTPSLAQEPPEPPSGKFTVQGSTLVYDTEAASDEANREIENEDVAEMLEALRATPGIRTLKLNSTGGSVWAGNEMSRVVVDFDLNTVVEGECSSSCVTVFLGGERRTMTRGSKIGFHQRSWAAGAIEAYYDSWRAEENWDTPFDFASWVYQDTQTETFKDLTYMIGRGVDAAFAIETKRLRSGTWFPTRQTMLEAGVLTE